MATRQTFSTAVKPDPFTHYLIGFTGGDDDPTLCVREEHIRLFLKETTCREGTTSFLRRLSPRGSKRVFIQARGSGHSVWVTQVWKHQEVS